MLPRPSIRENMPLYVNIGKQTFLLQEFVQTGCRSELRVSSEQEASIRNSKFLRRLRFVSPKFQP